METWHKLCVPSTVTKSAIRINGYFQPQSRFTSISFQDVCPEPGLGPGSLISWRAEIIIICIEEPRLETRGCLTNQKTVIDVADQ